MKNKKHFVMVRPVRSDSKSMSKRIILDNANFKGIFIVVKK